MHLQLPNSIFLKRYQHPFIMFRKIALLGLAVFSSAGLCAAQDALDNLKIGLEGLKQAGQDPALMAQLMRDMQVRS